VTKADDHGTLPLYAERLLRYLAEIEGRCAHGPTMHMQHVDHANRARQLGNHLEAAVQLSGSRHYPSSLVVIRAALEHHLMDRLIFLANRYVETYTGIKKEDAPAEEAKLAALQAGARPDIERWWLDDSGMNVVYRGLHSDRSKKGRGQTISPYYFRVDQFDPFTGGKKQAARLAGPFWRREHRERWAEEAAAEWRRYFVHDRVLKDLRVNRLLRGSESVQVDVHYAFLSGFAHPSKKGYEAIWGRNSPDGMGQFDHYASELVLLYVISLSAAELDAFGRMARRAPKLRLSDWDNVTSGVAEARLAASYFWFLGGEPTIFDRIETVHTPPGNRDPKWGRPRRDPRTLPPASVRYYADPLERLIRLHSSFQEMSTGLVYRSPFERGDAQFRR
jgi:hypothetical protein